MAHATSGRLPSKEAPFYLVTDYGYRFELTSMEAVFDRLSRDRVVLDAFNDAPGFVIPPHGRRHYGMAGLALLDANERPVDIAWLGPLYLRHLASLHDRRAARLGFRRAPVVGIHARHGGGSGMRYPRTIRSLRQVAGRVIEDLEPDWRGRTKDLPTAWDDQFTRSSRSWKRHRRHQWKGAW